VLEGFEAKIFHDGTQPVRWWKRNDCNGEIAGAMATAGVVLGNPAYLKTGGNIGDWLYFKSTISLGDHADPNHPAYGLMGWNDVPQYCGPGSQDGYAVYYGDDSARSMLGMMLAAAALKADRYDERLLKCLLANLRVSGSRGFQPDRLDQGPLEKAGWRHYFNARTRSYAPHFQATMWACYLWAHRQTKFELFLQRAKTAIGMTMDAYPDRWQWTNGIQQERAKMLWALAWLVRVEDTPEHRAWLRRIADDLLAAQDTCGAIREELGRPGKGFFAPPASNEAYGTSEAPLIQANGDAASDLLYTSNFAFIALHEAAAATGDAFYREAEDRLAAFLCRIQIRSERHPELDGGWFRAFDFKRWEYWASGADAGWGAWCIESGWTQSWITAVLALRQMNTSLWDVTKDSRISRHFDKLRREMVPDEALAAPDFETSKIAHAAVGKPVRLAAKADQRYPGFGPAGLTDGVLGLTDHRAAEWLGFMGTDLEAVVDLGAPLKIRRLGLHCLQSTRVGVFLPKQVEFAVSQDGKQFRVVKKIETKPPTGHVPTQTQTLASDGLDAEGRYMRVRAAHLGPLPEWVVRGSVPAWLFASEIVVNPRTKEAP